MVAFAGLGFHRAAQAARLDSHSTRFSPSISLPAAVTNAIAYYSRDCTTRTAKDRIGQPASVLRKEHTIRCQMGDSEICSIFPPIHPPCSVALFCDDGAGLNKDEKGLLRREAELPVCLAGPVPLSLVISAPTNHNAYRAVTRTRDPQDTWRA